MKASQLREDEHLGGTIGIDFRSGSRFQGVLTHIGVDPYNPESAVTVGFDDFDDILLFHDQKIAVFWPDQPWKDMGISEEYFTAMFDVSSSKYIVSQEEAYKIIMGEEEE